MTSQLYSFTAVKLVEKNVNTNSNEISFDEQLRNGYRVGVESFSDFFLYLSAHEYVSFHVLDQMRPEYLSDLQAPLIRVPDDSHGGRVQHYFAGFFFLPRLENKRSSVNVLQTPSRARNKSPKTLIADNTWKPPRPRDIFRWKYSDKWETFLRLIARTAFGRSKDTPRPTHI